MLEGVIETIRFGYFGSRITLPLPSVTEIAPQAKELHNKAIKKNLNRITDEAFPPLEV